MAQLTCRDLTLGYEGNPVIEHLSFSVNAGDYLYIVGENGSGKSTLMKALLRLKSPMAGTIETGDGLQADEIGYLPQQTAVQRDFPASVQEIVRSGCLNRCGFRPFYNRAEKQLAQKNMERLDITHLAKRCYRELSGGQQQRVLLARALCAARRSAAPDAKALPPASAPVPRARAAPKMPGSWAPQNCFPSWSSRACCWNCRCCPKHCRKSGRAGMADNTGKNTRCPGRRRRSEGGRP